MKKPTKRWNWNNPLWLSWPYRWSRVVNRTHPYTVCYFKGITRALWLFSNYFNLKEIKLRYCGVTLQRHTLTFRLSLVDTVQVFFFIFFCKFCHLCMQFARFGIVNFIYFENFEHFFNLTNHNLGHKLLHKLLRNSHLCPSPFPTFCGWDKVKSVC